MFDNFKAHLTSKVRDALAGLLTLTTEAGCLLTTLPPNMTSKVQILDVGINKPFKSHMNNSWLPFLLDAIEDETHSKKVSRKDMSKWIGDSWDLITPQTIQRTSRHIGFTDI